MRLRPGTSCGSCPSNKVTVRIVARNDGTGHRQASIPLHRSMTRTGRRCARYVSIATTADGRCSLAALGHRTTTLQSQTRLRPTTSDAHWCTLVDRCTLLRSVILDGSPMHPRCRLVTAFDAGRVRMSDRSVAGLGGYPGCGDRRQGYAPLSAVQ